jgi:hypothetical protein
MDLGLSFWSCLKLFNTVYNENVTQKWWIKKKKKKKLIKKKKKKKKGGVTNRVPMKLIAYNILFEMDLQNLILDSHDVS